MHNPQPLSFLRRVLSIDAIASAAMGIGLLVFASLLAPLFDLPEALLRETGIVLLPFAAFVGYLATREQPNRIAVWAVVVVNAIWTIDSIALLFTDWVAPNALGYALVIGQAFVVGTFAELEYVGLRKGALVAAR